MKGLLIEAADYGLILALRDLCYLPFMEVVQLKNN